MMIAVAAGKCEGYGNCVIAEPRVFDLDESGFVAVLDEDPSEELRPEVLKAVRDCPARALSIED